MDNQMPPSKPDSPLRGSADSPTINSILTRHGVHDPAVAFELMELINREQKEQAVSLLLKHSTATPEEATAVINDILDRHQPIVIPTANITPQSLKNTDIKSVKSQIEYQDNILIYTSTALICRPLYNEFPTRIFSDPLTDLASSHSLLRPLITLALTLLTVRLYEMNKLKWASRLRVAVWFSIIFEVVALLLVYSHTWLEITCGGSILFIILMQSVVTIRSHLRGETG